jgi:hypothetical protein
MLFSETEVLPNICSSVYIMHMQGHFVKCERRTSLVTKIDMINSVIKTAIPQIEMVLLFYKPKPLQKMQSKTLNHILLYEYMHNIKL